MCHVFTHYTTFGFGEVRDIKEFDADECLVDRPCGLRESCFFQSEKTLRIWQTSRLSLSTSIAWLLSRPFVLSGDLIGSLQTAEGRPSRVGASKGSFGAARLRYVKLEAMEERVADSILSANSTSALETSTTELSSWIHSGVD